LRERPWKESLLCNVALGARWPARLGQFRRARRSSRPGKGWGGSYGVLGVDLHRFWGRLCRRVGSTAAASGRRCAPCSGEAGTWQRQDAVGLAPGKAREGLGWFARHRRRVERRALLMATGVGHGGKGGRTVAGGKRPARFLWAAALPTRRPHTHGGASVREGPW
jgi:hypothetical protein